MQLNNLFPVIREICEEKNLSQEKVIETIEQALATAYRKDYGQKNQNIKVGLDLKTGEIAVFDVKTVVEDQPETEEETKKPEKKTKGKSKKAGEEKKEEKEIEKEDEDKELRFNPRKEIFLSEAKKIKKGIKIGDEIKTKLEVPSSFGRVAAQAAKQVIVQRLREAEKEVLYNEFKGKEGKVMTGIVQRHEGRNVFVDLEKITALLPFEEQIDGEECLPGQKIKVYILEVKTGPRGPEIIVSRSHPEILIQLFKTEIPEIANGTVEIKAVAREAGGRSKIAVFTKEKGVDPVGACIGQRGSRIQTIIGELSGEKIDIIEYADNPVKFVISALSPAKISGAKIIDEKNKIIVVKVKPDQVSLAIGRHGQNVCLAAKLTGWKIEIEKEKSGEGELEKEEIKEEKK